MKLAIPMPLQVVVDDVGWWSGRDDSGRGGPYRTGIERDHVAADYAALADLGRALGARPLAAFVACEWDTRNLLRRAPSSTWMGRRWDNRRRLGPWQAEAADIVRRNRDHLELAVHGLGHEHWPDGRLERAEFHDAAARMRPRRHVVRHLELFGELLEQHRLGPFPRAFVPPALHHSFGAGGDGIQGILHTFGVRWVSANFASCRQHAPPLRPELTVDAGVLLLDRRAPFVPWNALDATPSFAFDQPICALHWPNLLHPDPARNGEVVARWAAFLRPFGDRLDGMLAPTAGACFTQAAYRTLAAVDRVDRGFEIDLAAVRALDTDALEDRFTVKVEAPAAHHWTLDGGQVASSERDRARGGGRHVLVLAPHRDCDRLRLRAVADAG